MKELKNPVIFALIIVVAMLLLDKCTRNKINTSINNISAPEVISEKIETETIEGKDSVTIEYVDRIVYVAAQYVPLDSQRMDLSDTNVFHDKYYYSREDSLLDFTITVDSEIKPNDVQIEYNLLQRDILKSTTRVDTVKTTITNKVRVNQIYFGGSAVVYPSFKAVFAEVDFVSKKGFQIEGGIGFMDNAPAIKGGFKWLINLRKQRSNK
jgi:hypothetical protein